MPADSGVATSTAADRNLVDAFISASRALVAVAARSLAEVGEVAEVGEDVTLPQYRTLVILRARGPQKAAEVATALGVSPPTASRMIERLVRKGLVRRARDRDDRRRVRIALTDVGDGIVAAVTDRRRREIEDILAQMPHGGREQLTDALRSFAEAAGEVPDQDWSLGWGE